ncbi:MAG: hypothetical protein ABI741_14240 [Ferruginibacter sp.]
MKYLLTIFFSLLTFFSTAQIDQADSISLGIVEKQGTEMAKLLLAKDYKAFAKYTYQPIIEMTGGEEKMIELIKQSFDQMETGGYSFINFTIEKPLTIVHFNNTLQCALIENIEMKVPKGRLTSKSTLIGISSDKGQNWTFIDTHGADLKTLQKTLSGLSNDLVIPEKQQPVFFKE